MLPGYGTNHGQDGVTREDLIKALYKLDNKNIGAVRIDSSASNYYESLLPTKKDASAYSSVNKSEHLNKTDIITNIRQAATNIVHLMDKEYVSHQKLHQSIGEQDLFDDDTYHHNSSKPKEKPGFVASSKSAKKTYDNPSNTFRHKNDDSKNEKDISNQELENLYLMYFKKKPVEENSEKEYYHTDRGMYTQASQKMPVEDRLLRYKTNRDQKLKILAEKNKPTFKPQLDTKMKKSSRYD